MDSDGQLWTYRIIATLYFFLWYAVVLVEVEEFSGKRVTCVKLDALTNLDLLLGVL